MHRQTDRRTDGRTDVSYLHLTGELAAVQQGHVTHHHLHLLVEFERWRHTLLLRDHLLFLFLLLLFLLLALLHLRFALFLLSHRLQTQTHTHFRLTHTHAHSRVFQWSGWLLDDVTGRMLKEWTDDWWVLAEACGVRKRLFWQRHERERIWSPLSCSASDLDYSPITCRFFWGDDAWTICSEHQKLLQEVSNKLNQQICRRAPVHLSTAAV